MSVDKIITLVSQELLKRAADLGKYTFLVPKKLSFRDEEGLWHIFVVPNRIVEKRGQFYDILNDIEEVLEKKHHENVMLVPVKSKTTSAASAGA